MAFFSNYNFECFHNRIVKLRWLGRRQICKRAYFRTFPKPKMTAKFLFSAFSNKNHNRNWGEKVEKVKISFFKNWKGAMAHDGGDVLHFPKSRHLPNKRSIQHTFHIMCDFFCKTHILLVRSEHTVPPHSMFRRKTPSTDFYIKRVTCGSSFRAERTFWHPQLQTARRHIIDFQLSALL